MPQHGPQLTSIDDVLGRMAELDATLPAADGVRWFNTMYRQVTGVVLAATEGTVFEDDEFLTRLDVVFAELYFAACDADAAGGEVPAAWAPLFEHRSRPDTHPVQFALAGMNAHINHDLPLAVVQACRDLGVEVADDTPEHRDFVRVNDVLAVAYGEVKERFGEGLAGVVDDAAGRVDDAMELWSIEAARSLAWVTAGALWAFDDPSAPRSLFLTMLGRSVGLAGRGILL